MAYSEAGDGMSGGTFQPRCSILVERNGRAVDWASPRVRNNYSQSDDLGLLLGDGASVVINKSIHSIKGEFAIVLPDRPDYLTGDTIYANLAPMDHVELRMAHKPSASLINGKMPLVMRGFITGIERRAGIDASGKPTSLYVIRGADYGKILEQLKIYYSRNYAVGSLLSTAYAMYLQYDISGQTLSAKDFFTQMVEKIINPYLDGVKRYGEDGEGKATRIIPKIADTDASIWVHGLSSHEGSVWELLSSVADLAWHELFIEDQEDAPYLVYRPNPYAEIDGTWIEQEGFYDPGSYHRSHDVISDINVERTDANVANWFILEAPLMGQLFGAAYNRALLASKDPWTYLEDYPHCSPTLYGDRRLKVILDQAPRNHPTSINSVHADNIPKLKSLWLPWLAKRRETLAKFNRENAVLESGTVTMLGDETIKPGRYLYIHRGEFVQWMYITAVSHTFHPYYSYTTTVQFERGSGWLVRQQAANNPALMERSRGAKNG